MPTELLVAIISAVVALLAAAITIWGQTRSVRITSELRRKEEDEKRRREEKKEISRFHEPLLYAAYDLQSRIYNLLELDMIAKHYQDGDERSRHYVVDNTAFLIAQYFGWTEIIRQGGLFLDLGGTEQNRKLNAFLNKITQAWLRDDIGRTLCIFRGNQRVIGELMIEYDTQDFTCLTYGGFLLALQDETAGALMHLHHLQQDVSSALENIDLARSRFIHLQHALIDLINFLDPQFIRFPKEGRGKLGFA